MARCPVTVLIKNERSIHCQKTLRLIKKVMWLYGLFSKESGVCLQMSRKNGYTLHFLKCHKKVTIGFIDMDFWYNFSNIKTNIFV